MLHLITCHGRIMPPLGGALVLFLHKNIRCGYSLEAPGFVFLFLHKNICCGYSLEAHNQGASNEYPQHNFLWRNKKTINTFGLKKASCQDLCNLLAHLS